MLWDTVVGGLFKVLDKIIPDPVARDAARAKLVEMENARELAFFQGEITLAEEQIKTNAVEAQNPSLFVSGWRPGVGWISVLGLFYSFLGQPLLAWGSAIWSFPAPPALDLTNLMTLLVGMLGMGAYRTAEKLNGVAAK